VKHAYLELPYPEKNSFLTEAKFREEKKAWVYKLRNFNETPQTIYEKYTYQCCKTLLDD
jgi:hypothetical protein